MKIMEENQKTNTETAQAPARLLPSETLPRLEVRSLKAGLRNMPVGTAAVVAGDTTDWNVRRACSQMKSEGMLFSTSSRTGVIVVMRIK